MEPSDAEMDEIESLHDTDSEPSAEPDDGKNPPTETEVEEPEAVLEADADSEVQETAEEGSTVRPTEPTEELHQSEPSQEPCVEEESISVDCEEIFEEIGPREDNANNGELIGIDCEDHTERIVENFCGEIEIKEEEEELEFNPDYEQDLLQDDPILSMPIPLKEESEDNLESTVQVKDNARRRSKKSRSSSETETADEGEDDGNETTPVAEHSYHATPIIHPKKQPRRRAVKQKYPLVASPYMPRNVRNYLYTRNSTHTCLECNGQFFTMVQYLKHRKRHPKVEDFPYQCHYCTTKFRLHRDMLPHFLTHSKLEKLSCPMCPIEVFSAHKLVNHMQVHRSSPRENYYFKCVTCSVRFSKCTQLEDHNLISHPKYVNGVPVKPVIQKTIEHKNATRTVHVCFHCGKVECTWPQLLVHMRIHKGPLACTICLLSLKNSDEFAEHVVKVHKDMGELTYYQCRNPSCPKEFVSSRKLRQHEVTCLPLGGEYRCEICDQLYREVDHFITHMELHSMLSNELGHKMCPHCVFPTNDPSEYAAHLVNHHGYRDRVDTLERIYEDYLKQEDSAAASSDESSVNAADDDDDDDDDDAPNEAEQEKKARHIADGVVQVCE